MKKQEKQNQKELLKNVLNNNYLLNSFTPDRTIADGYYCGCNGELWDLYNKVSKNKLIADQELTDLKNELLDGLYYTTIDKTYTGNPNTFTRTEKIRIEKDGSNYLLFFKFTKNNKYFYIEKLA